MAMILDQHLSYETCDVCGDGNAHMSAWYLANGTYEYRRESRCYGNVQLTALSREELSEQVKKDWFLIATRRSRTQLKAFMTRLNRGEFEPTESNDQFRGGITASEPSDWEAELLYVADEPTSW